MTPTPRPRYRAQLRACVAALSVSLVFPLAQTAFALDGTWTNTTSGLLWSTAGNWTGTTVADGSGFTANFNTLNPTASIIVNVDSARTIGNLVFGDTDITSTASWTLGNSNNAANILTLSGTTPTITVNALGTNSLVTISAVIAGTNGLTKDGTGTTTTGILTLSGANTYSGGTTISTGSIRAQNNTALGSGAVTVANGARLQLGAGITMSNTINLNGTSALYGNTGANTLSGTVNLQSASTVNMNSANDNNLTLTGPLNLSGNTLTVSTVGNTNSFVTIDGVINGAGGITKSGSGIMTINNDQTSTYSGTTTLSLGTLAIGHDGALGSGTFTFGANDNPVNIRSLNTASRTLANAVTLAGNAGTNAVFNFGSTNASFNGDLTFSNTGNISMGSISRKFAVNNTTRFSGGFTGTGGITLQTGTGTLVLNGNSTYTGATAVNAGTLFVNGSHSTVSTATVTVASGARLGGTGSVGNVTFNSGAALAYAVATAAQGGDGLTTTGFSGTGVGSFTIFLSGAATGFDSSQNYSWAVLSSNSTDIAGIVLSNLALDTTGFGQAFTGSFNLTKDTGSIYVNYVGSMIPEPSSYALLAGGILLGFATLRRRR